jgi:hypothetical protein
MNSSATPFMSASFPIVLGERLIDLEVAVSRRAARVNDPLGNPLVVEAGDFLATDESFQ